MDFSADIKTEVIQQQVIKILYDHLNSEIASRSAAWIAADTAFYASIGRPAPDFSVESIANDNFYPGVVTSLINAPIDKYPNVSAYCWSAIPTTSRDDIAEEYAILVSIEVMVKSIESELEANSRIQKTLEAIHAVIVKNQSLNNTANTMNAPSKTMGDIFVRREEHSRGPRWFWQGGSLTYPVEKYGKLF